MEEEGIDPSTVNRNPKIIKGKITWKKYTDLHIVSLRLVLIFFLLPVHSLQLLKRKFHAWMFWCVESVILFSISLRNSMSTKIKMSAAHQSSKETSRYL